MSIIPIRLSILFYLVAALAVLAGPAAGQPLRARVVINGSPRPEARISGSFAKPVRAFVFETSRAGFRDLDRRIESIVLRDGSGNEVRHHQGGQGSIFADAPVVFFEYKVALNAPLDPALAAHASWIKGERGLLMTSDLLPAADGGDSSAEIEFAVPNGWQIFSAIKAQSGGQYLVPDRSGSVFFIGANPRTFNLFSEGSRISFSIQGEWQFSDSEAASMIGEIVSHYKNLFGSVPFAEIAVILIRTPDDAAVDRWSAETRLNSVVIASSPSRYKNLGAQRLHEQLRHELLHLWIPNSLKLTGDYSWFYEGFILYEALKTGVRLQRIRFSDVLNSIAEAYGNTSGGPGRKKELHKPLIGEASRDWGNNAGALYSKGMLVAFLCDAAMMERSGGGRQSEEILREVYRAGAGNGTEVVLGILARYKELLPIVRDLIKGTRAPEWATALEAAGLTASADGFRWKLEVKKKLSRRQKAILKRLGYNDSR